MDSRTQGPGLSETSPGEVSESLANAVNSLSSNVTLRFEKNPNGVQSNILMELILIELLRNFDQIMEDSRSTMRVLVVIKRIAYRRTSDELRAKIVEERGQSFDCIKAKVMDSGLERRVGRQRVVLVLWTPGV